MRKLSTAALLLFCGDALARALGFFASVHLARALGAESFGVVTIGLSFLSYALWFADLGLTTLGAREIARPAVEQEYKAHGIFTARLLLGGIVLLLSLGVAALLYQSDPLRVVVAAYLLCIVTFALSLEWYYQGSMRYPALALSRVLSAGVYFCAIYYLVSSPADLARVPLLYLAATGASALFLIVLKRNDSLLPRSFSLPGTLVTVKRASRIGVGGICAQTVQLLPPLVLGYFSTADAGVLGAAMKVVFVLLIVDRVFAALFLPSVARLWGRGREVVEENLERVLRVMIVIAFALGTTLSLHAPLAMRLIFSREYEGGATALGIISWFAVATLVNSLFSFGLIGSGNERGYLRATTIGGVITVILSVALIAIWGLNGAAAAMVASEICVVALTYRELRQSIRLRFARPLLLSAVVSSAMLLLSFFLPFDQLWSVPVVTLGFLGLVYVAGGVTREDIIWLVKR